MSSVTSIMNAMDITVPRYALWCTWIEKKYFKQSEIISAHFQHGSSGRPNDEASRPNPIGFGISVVLFRERSLGVHATIAQYASVYLVIYKSSFTILEENYQMLVILLSFVTSCYLSQLVIMNCAFIKDQSGPGQFLSVGIRIITCVAYY